MRTGKTLITAIVLFLASFMLTGYRPSWDSQVAKECSRNMAQLEIALESLPKGSATGSGSGDLITDYPLLKNGLLTTLPVCPAEQFREPAPLPYIVEKASDSSLIVKCRIHGARSNLIYLAEDAYQDQDLLEKATAAKRTRHETMLILSAVILGLAPVMLFLAARFILGYEFVARRAIMMKTLFLVTYGGIVAIGFLLFIGTGAPLDTFVKSLFAVSILSYFFGRYQLSSYQKRFETTEKEADNIRDQ